MSILELTLEFVLSLSWNDILFFYQTFRLDFKQGDEHPRTRPGFRERQRPRTQQ